MSPKMHRRDIPRQELIGLKVKVVDASNQDLIGLQGIIVNETKNTLVIEHEKKAKTVLKKQVTLQVKMDEHLVRIDGKMLLGRSEDRVKK